MAAECKESASFCVQDVAFKGHNNGNFEWNITNKELINQILNAKNAELFESKPFVMAKLKWKLQLFPNGDKEENTGNVKIFLKLISMADIFDSIIVSLLILCNQTNSCYTRIKTYTQTIQRFGWSDKALLLKEWKSIKITNISISTEIKIQHIVWNKSNNNILLSEFLPFQLSPSYKKNLNIKSKTKYVYKLDKKTIENAYNGKRIESKTFDNRWKLLIYPNGYSHHDTGFIGIFLAICNISPFVSFYKTKFSIICQEINKVQNYTKNLFYQTQSWGPAKFIDKNHIKNMEHITFIVDIEILKVEYVEQSIDESIVYDPVKINQILSFISEENKQSLSSHIEQNNDMMKQMQNNIAKMSKQMNNLRLLITEEKKDGELDEMKKEIASMKQNINILMKEKANDYNKENKELEAMKRWMTNVIKLPQYIDLFVENGFDDLDVIKDITMETITSIGIDKIGHKMKIIKAVKKLNQQNQHRIDNEGGTAYI